MMLEWYPITITVWGGSGPYVKLGPVERPYDMGGAIARNAPGSWRFTVDDDDERIEALIRDDARVTIDYRPEPSRPALRLLSGTLSDASNTGTYGNKSRSFEVIDDWADLFNEVTGWPNPTGSGSQQGQDSAYYTSKGPAETVVLDIARVNLQRLGLMGQYFIPPSQGRGKTLTIKIRMHSLAERLFPAIDNAGLMVRVIQQNDGLKHVLVTVPPTRTQVLRESAGVVEVPEWSSTKPLKTRYVVGAGGEGVARYFTTFIKSDWEDQYKVIREGFIDARDVEIAATDRDAVLESRAEEQFMEDAPKSSMKAILAETEDWAFGETFNLGDVVRIKPQGLTENYLEHYVSEVAFDVEDESGLCVVTPLVGEWSDSTDDKMASIVRQLEKAVRDQQRSL